MSEITIVTAFFDIGRKDFEIIARDNRKYIEDFSVWARIRNKLVVYTEERFREEILNIRKRFGREKDTIIITIEDIEQIEPDILRQYQKIAQSRELENFKVLRGTISANKPIYDYLMLLKYWFLMDAERRGEIERYGVWLDFGYGHGDFFANSDEFDFEWKYDFGERITLFTCHDLDEVPIYEVVRCSLNYIMGFMVIAPEGLCAKLWKYVREAADMMTRVGFIDDDQTVLLLAYRNHSNDFTIKASDWFMPLVTWGGSHLTLTRKSTVEAGGPIVESQGILTRHKRERKGIYFVVDQYRVLKGKLKKPPLRKKSEKYAKDCAERTYKRVCELYWNDRSS